MLLFDGKLKLLALNPAMFILWCKGTIFHAQCTMISSFSLSHAEGAEPLSSLSSRISVILFTSLHILQTLKNKIIGSTQMVINAAAAIKYIKTLNASIISILLDYYLIIFVVDLSSFLIPPVFR